jgi:hypothetical protein
MTFIEQFVYKCWEHVADQYIEAGLGMAPEVGLPFVAARTLTLEAAMTQAEWISDGQPVDAETAFHACISPFLLGWNMLTEKLAIFQVDAELVSCLSDVHLASDTADGILSTPNPKQAFYVDFMDGAFPLGPDGGVAAIFIGVALSQPTCGSAKRNPTFTAVLSPNDGFDARFVSWRYEDDCCRTDSSDRPSDKDLEVEIPTAHQIIGQSTMSMTAFMRRAEQLALAVVWYASKYPSDNEFTLGDEDDHIPFDLPTVIQLVSPQVILSGADRSAAWFPRKHDRRLRTECTAEQVVSGITA